jgi:hypothetical protein
MAQLPPGGLVADVAVGVSGIDNIQRIRGRSDSPEERFCVGWQLWSGGHAFIVARRRPGVTAG